MISRREVLTRFGAAGVVALAPRAARAQTARKIDPPSVISNPPRDFSRGHAAQSVLRDDIMRRPDDELAKLLGSVRRSAPHEYA